MGGEGEELIDLSKPKRVSVIQSKVVRSKLSLYLLDTDIIIIS